MQELIEMTDRVMVAHGVPTIAIEVDGTELDEMDVMLARAPWNLLMGAITHLSGTRSTLISISDELVVLTAACDRTRFEP